MKLNNYKPPYFLSRNFLDKTLKLIFLLALFLIPIYFATFFKSFNIFNLNKVFVFRIFLNLALLLTVVREILYPSSLILNIRNFFYKYWLLPSIFIVLLGLSLFFSENIILSFFGSIDRQQGYLNFILYYLWFVILSFNLSVFKERSLNESDFKKYLKTIAVVIIATGGLISIYGILQILNIDFQEWTSAAFISKRASSTFGNPNFFASWMLLIIPLTFYFFIKSKNTYYKLIYFLLSFFSIVSIFITGSRAGLLGLLFSLFLFLAYLLFIKKISRKNRLLAVLLFIIFSTSSLLVYNQIFPGRIKNTINLVNVDERIDFYNSAILAIKEKPIFGYGQENLVSVFVSYYQPDWGMRTVGQIPDRVHNLFLDILMFGGFMALIAFLILYSHFFKLSYLSLKNNDFRDPALSLAIGTAAYLFSLQFGFSIPAGEIYLFTFLALLVAYDFKSDVKENKKYLIKQSFNVRINDLKLILLFFTFCFSFFFFYRTINIIKADHYFAKAVLAWNKSNYLDAIKYFNKIDKIKVNKVNLAYYQSYSVDRILNTYAYIKGPAVTRLFEERISYLDYALSGKEFYIILSKVKIKGALGQFSEAKDLLVTLQKDAPYLPALNIEEARLQLSMGNREAAKIAFEQALNNMPEYQGGYSNFHYMVFISLASIYEQDRDFSEADKYYKLAYRANPEDMELLYKIREGKGI